MHKEVSLLDLIWFPSTVMDQARSSAAGKAQEKTCLCDLKKKNQNLPLAKGGLDYLDT